VRSIRRAAEGIGGEDAVHGSQSRGRTAREMLWDGIEENEP